MRLLLAIALAALLPNITAAQPENIRYCRVIASQEVIIVTGQLCPPGTQEI